MDLLTGILAGSVLVLVALFVFLGRELDESPAAAGEQPEKRDKFAA
jgi:hypothetical protein